MPTVHLSDRIAVRVDGPDAEHFLQNIITTDLDSLKPGEAKPAALLTPQGKILFDFIISRHGETDFLLDCRTDVADDFLRRLTLYRLRAKVEISKQDQLLVVTSWGSDSDGSQTDSTRSDTRFPADLFARREYIETVHANGSESDYAKLRIDNGVVESGADYDLSDAFPHDILLDQSGGIGFRKGCYVGQEVVSRMQHRGTARRRVMIVEGAGDLPERGTDLRVNDRAIGTLGSVLSNKANAIVRIDRVKDALDAGLPIMAGDVSVTLAIPSWATYSLPETPSGEDA